VRNYLDTIGTGSAAGRGVFVRVVAYVTASVDDGPWTTVPLTFNTSDPVITLLFGDPAAPLFTYPTADPEFRAHLERIYAAIGQQAMRQPVSLPAD
jgi:hypothetical protein